MCVERFASSVIAISMVYSFGKSHLELFFDRLYRICVDITSSLHWMKEWMNEWMQTQLVHLSWAIQKTFINTVVSINYIQVEDLPRKTSICCVFHFISFCFPFIATISSSSSSSSNGLTGLCLRCWTSRYVNNIVVIAWAVPILLLFV